MLIKIDYFGGSKSPCPLTKVFSLRLSKIDKESSLRWITMTAEKKHTA